MATYTTLSPQEAQVIDGICNRFEDALRQKQATRITDWLTQVGAPMRPALFRELVLVEQSYFPERTPQHYFDRYPEYREHLTYLFAANLPFGRVAPAPAGLSLENLLQQLQSLPLLSAERRQQLADELVPRFRQPRALLAELVRCDWVTPYQANMLGQQRGPELLLGQYLLLHRLGRGGMGQVFKAWNTRLGRIVALKLIRTDRLSSPAMRRRFAREIRAAAHLQHPHIVRAYDAAAVGDIHFLVMEHLEGTNLQHLVDEEGPAPADRACEWIRQAAQGLQHAHERGLIHRDIKPANLFIDRRRHTVKLLDLGLARFDAPEEERLDTSGEMATAGPASSAVLTQVGTVMGTPDFMAPEQARDATQADVRSDLYSLGATLFYLLTGRSPFGGRSLAEKFALLLDSEAPSVQSVRPDVPAPVAAVVERLLRKRPEQRYQSAAELSEALAACRGLCGPVAPAPAEPAVPANPFADLSAIEAPPAAPSSPRTATRRWPRWSLAAAALAIIAVATSSWMNRGAQTDPPESAPPAAPAKPAVAVLDRLRPEHIPASERFPWQPKELIAVLGSHERRHWGHGTVVAFHPDGQVFASGGMDGFVHIYRVADGKRTMTFGPFPSALDKTSVAPVSGLVFSPEQIAAGFEDGSLRVWGAADGTELVTVRNVNSISCMALAPDRQTLVTGSGDGTLYFWSGSNWAGPLTPRAGHEGLVYQLAISPDGKLLASGGHGAIRLWDLAERSLLAEFEWQNHTVAALDFHPDSKSLLATSHHQTMQLLDVTNPRKPTTLKTSQRRVYAARFTRDGESFIAGGEVGLEIWDANELTIKKSLLMHNVGSLALSRDERCVVTGNGHGTIHLWDTATWKELHPLSGSMGPISTVSFAPDGSALAYPGFEPTYQEVDRERAYFIEPVLRVWDLDKAQPNTDSVKSISWRTGPGFANLMAERVFMLDRNRIATIYSGTVSFWNVKDAWHVQSSEIGGDVRHAAVTRDGQHLGVAYHRAKDSVGIWTLDPWPIPAPLDGKEEAAFVTNVAFAPDDKVMSAAGANVLVRHWNVATGKPAATPWKLGVHYAVLAYRPDGQVLAAGTTGTISFWDVTKERQLESLLWPEGREISRLAYSADGKYLAAQDKYGRAAWWDAAGRQQLGSWKPPGYWSVGVNTLAFAPDSRHLVLGNANGTVYVLRLPPR